MMLKYIPNFFTILRLFLIFPVIYLLLIKHYYVALLLFIIAGVTDSIDGYIARKYHWITRFGAMLDPMADKLLLLSCFFVLTWQECIPSWLLIIMLTRDFIIVTGAVTYHYLVGPYQFSPTVVSKANTFLQVSLIIFLLLEQSSPVIPAEVIIALVYAMLTTTLVSLADYVWTWGGLAWRQCKQ